jgi:hypothetical protein
MHRNVFHARLVSLAIAILVALAVVAACGGDTKPATKATPAPTQAPTLEPGTVAGSVGEGRSVRSEDGRLEVRATSGGPLDVTLKPLASAPAAPRGWQLVGATFEITARDRGRPVTQLAAPLQLRFKASDGVSTVMYFNGKEWILVESEVESGGWVVAQVDHLTPYAAAKPMKTTAPTGGNASSTAQTALEAAVERIKNKHVRVSGASTYIAGSGVALPPAIQAALSSVAAGGAVYYGLYGGVNEALTSSAGSGAPAGTFSLLIEPQPSFPANQSEAQFELAAIFPGAGAGRYTPAVQSQNAYTYYGTLGSTAFTMGFVQYQGLSFAFVASGTGNYYATAISTKDVP